MTKVSSLRYFALEDAVDAHASFEVELAFELGSAPEQGGDLGGRDLWLHGLGPIRRRGHAATSVMRQPVWRANTSPPRVC